MTTFDRAFIKAFTDTPHTGGTDRSAAGPRAAHQRPSPEPVADVVSIADVEKPHVASHKSAMPPRPLSSFAAQPKVHDACQALLEVDRLEWPAVCRELLSRAGRDWDRFTEQLIAQMGQGHKCVALAGVERACGRTSVALAAARHLAGRGLRPVVVDADVENPTLVRGCGISVQTGWDDLVTGELGLGEALIVAVEDGVTLLPWRGANHTMVQLAGMLRTGNIFGTLREHYDLTLVDTMPLVGKTAIADFAAFASAIHLDAVYLVHHQGLTSREQLAAACSKLRRSGVPLAAIVENFAPPGGTDAVSYAKDSIAAGARPLAALG